MTVLRPTFDRLPLHGAQPLLKLGETIVNRRRLFLGGILNDL